METIQSVPGGGPERPVMVDEQTRDKAVAQTVWICRIVLVRLELSGPPVETEEPVAISANPEIA